MTDTLDPDPLDEPIDPVTEIKLNADLLAMASQLIKKYVAAHCGGPLILAVSVQLIINSDTCIKQSALLPPGLDSKFAGELLLTGLKELVERGGWYTVYDPEEFLPDD